MSETRESIQIEIVYATPSQQTCHALSVPCGTTVIQAIEQSGILQSQAEHVASELDVGIFSKRVSLETRLHAGDRIEIYRPLHQDPKQSRRKRETIQSDSNV